MCNIPLCRASSLTHSTSIVAEIRRKIMLTWSNEDDEDTILTHALMLRALVGRCSLPLDCEVVEGMAGR